MGRNRVQVTIEGDDQLSGVLDRIQDRLQGMGQGFMGRVMDFGFDVAQKAVGGFMSAVDKANAATVDNVKSVGGLAAAMGASYENADQLNNKIVNGLAKQAALLPGTTDDYVTLYRGISDDVASANKELNNGKFDAAQYEKQIVNLASKFQVLGDGMPVSRTLQSLQGLLGGRSIGQLGKLQYFMKNPVLLKNLQEVLKGKKLQDLNSGERLQVALKAVDMSLTDDTVKRLTTTFDAVKQGFLTKVFDPNVGMFGLLRDVDDNLGNGVQNAFQAITEALDSVIGDNGVLTALGNMLSALGLNLGDPMVILRNGFLAFANFMRGIAGFFNQITSLTKSNPAAAQQMLGSIPEKIGQWLAGIVNAVANAIANTNVGQILQIGGAIVGAISKGLLSFAANLSPQTYLVLANAAMGVALAPMVMGIITAILGAIVAATAGLPLALIAAAGLATAALIAAIAQNWGNITGSIVGFFSGAASWLAAGWTVVMTAISGFFTNLGMFFSDLWLGVITVFPTIPAIFNLFGAIFNLFMALGGMVVGFTGMVFGYVFSFFGSLFNLFGSIASTIFNFAVTMVAALFAPVQAAITLLFDLIAQGWMMLQATVAGWMAQISAVITGFLQGVVAAWNAIKTTFETAWSNVVNTLAGVINGIAGAINQVRSLIPSFGGGGTAAPAPGHAATGFLPGTGLGGLLGAAISEAGKMPSGAGLMMANDSEAILNQGQQASLASMLNGAIGMQRAPAARSGGTFAPQIAINASPGMDVGALANEVMARIDAAYRQYELGFLG